MRVLLDTHVWLWMLTAPERLGAHRERFEDTATELFLSAASSWEIGIKYRLGRLHLPSPPERYVPERMRSTGVRALPVEHAHALGVASLPLLHRDPFDRLLVAQARHHELAIATADTQIHAYDVDVIAL